MVGNGVRNLRIPSKLCRTCSDFVVGTVSSCDKTRLLVVGGVSDARHSTYIESRPHATVLCHPAATVLFSFFDRDDLAADTSASLAASWASAHTRPRPSV